MRARRITTKASLYYYFPHFPWRTSFTLTPVPPPPPLATKHVNNDQENKEPVTDFIKTSQTIFSKNEKQNAKQKNKKQKQGRIDVNV